MFNRLRDRLGAKAAAIGVATALLGGGVAVALPDEAITGQETAEANQEAAEERALAAQESAEANQEAAAEKALAAQESAEANQEAPADEAATAESETFDIAEADGVPEVVETFLADLEIWVSCVQEGAAAHADQQSNEDTRIEDDEYDDDDKLTLCGEKPENPNDVNGTDEVEAEGDPDDGDRGRPEDAGEPEDAGRPDDAGEPEDAGRPNDAGEPEDAGRPDDAGKPNDAGPES